jgi:radical SAM superfamily enzyme with C-terminal helix-hairpin-helix motif
VQYHITPAMTSPGKRSATTDGNKANWSEIVETLSTAQGTTVLASPVAGPSRQPGTVLSRKTTLISLVYSIAAPASLQDITALLIRKKE